MDQVKHQWRWGFVVKGWPCYGGSAGLQVCFGALTVPKKVPRKGLDDIQTKNSAIDFSDASRLDRSQSTLFCTHLEGFGERDHLEKGPLFDQGRRET